MGETDTCTMGLISMTDSLFAVNDFSDLIAAFGPNMPIAGR